ncbi:MAG: tetratricopeptide repeat protein [Ferruginibacter sp.]
MAKESKSKIDAAWDYFDKDDLKNAMKIGNSLVRIKKWSLMGNYLLGHIYFKQKEFLKAIEHFNNALKLDVNSKIGGFILYWMGKVYDYSELWPTEDNLLYDKAKAIKSYVESKKYNTYPADVIFSIAPTLNDYEKVVLYGEGIKKFPNEVDFYIYLSKLHRRMGYLSKEVEVLELAISKGIESSSLLFNLGIHYFEQKRYSESERYFRLCLEFNSNDNAFPLIHYQLGNCFYEQKLFDKAIHHYKQGVETGRNDNGIWYNFMGLAICYKRQAKIENLNNFISDIPADKKYFGYIGFEYGLMSYFDGKILEEVQFIQDGKELILILENLKFGNKNNLDSFKISLLIVALHDYLNDSLSKLNILRTCDTNFFGVDFIADRLSESYNNLLSTEMFNDEIFELFIFDIENDFFRDTLVESVLADVIGTLFNKKKYGEIVSLFEKIDDRKIEKLDLLFRYAYSLGSINKPTEAKQYYELYLKSNPKSSAVLNKLV